MAVTHTFFLFAVMAITAHAYAAPTRNSKPFHVPGVYFTGGGPSGMSIEFNEDGTFRTWRKLPPFACDNKPVCPELGGQGTWSYAPDSGVITLKQTITQGWTVTQEWRKGSATVDLYSTFINGNWLISRIGQRSDEFPLPWGAVNWERTKFPHHYAKPELFKLPATYVTGDVGGVSITFNKDGTFQALRESPTSVCLGMHTCPKRSGQGTWTWNQDVSQLSLKEEVTPGRITEQVWELKGMSRDHDTSEITGVRLVSSEGKHSGKLPIPQGDGPLHWKRTDKSSLGHDGIIWVRHR